MYYRKGKTALLLRDNFLDNEDIEDLINIISQNPDDYSTLKLIDLSDNFLNDIHISQLLTLLPNLQVVDVTDTCVRYNSSQSDKLLWISEMVRNLIIMTFQMN